MTRAPRLIMRAGRGLSVRTVLMAFARVYRLAPDASLLEAYEQARIWS